MSKPRIISGKAKGIRIQDVPGQSTRPITDRVKEAFFNILSVDIVDSNFLDLFGGTGSVGIESLSRGAKSCTFVELNSFAIKTIKNNLETTKLIAGATVFQMDAFRYLATPKPIPFDYIYIAPPQYKQMWKKALELLDQNIDCLSEDGWVIIQIHPIEFEEIFLTNLLEFDRREYGSTLLQFYSRKFS
ncbi:MAG: 16S rRNA (guanine(966)-N(2))-methyltransferase RsmD [Chloroflexi bacterium]|nr:16S rRNA (guanine(966)-N(2))-methyltransferase RsmD [Chloroflexota bacterium]